MYVKIYVNVIMANAWFLRNMTKMQLLITLKLINKITNLHTNEMKSNNLFIIINSRRKLKLFLFKI